MKGAFKIIDAGSARSLTNQARLAKSRDVDLRSLFKRMEHVAKQGHCRFLLDHKDPDNHEYLIDALRTLKFEVEYTEYGVQIDW